MKIIGAYSHQPWNKGKLVGQKAPLRVRDFWAIRVRLQPAEMTRDLALCVVTGHRDAAENSAPSPA